MNVTTISCKFFSHFFNGLSEDHSYTPSEISCPYSADPVASNVFHLDLTVYLVTVSPLVTSCGKHLIPFLHILGKSLG